MPAQDKRFREPKQDSSAATAVRLSRVRSALTTIIGAHSSHRRDTDHGSRLHSEFRKDGSRQGLGCPYRERGRKAGHRVLCTARLLRCDRSPTQKAADRTGNHREALHLYVSWDTCFPYVDLALTRSRRLLRPKRKTSAVRKRQKSFHRRLAGW